MNLLLGIEENIGNYHELPKSLFSHNLVKKEKKI